MKKVVITLGISFLITSCSFAPEYSRPKVSLPSVKNTEKSIQKEEISTDWWKQFGDENLNRLIEEALKNNDNLLLAYERINEAAALYGLARSNLYPLLQGNAQPSRFKTSKEVNPFSKAHNDFQISGVLSYEVDIWGKLRNEKRAKLSSLLAQKAYADAVKLKLISDVASLYFDICAVNRQIEITKDLVKKHEESLSLRKKQYEIGLIDVLPVEMEKSQLNNTKLTLEKLIETRKVLNNSLSLLLGREPKEIFEKKEINCSKLPEPIEIPPFLPSELLNRRPDIIQAEEELKAANYSIGVAKANYFPSISLTGALGFESSTLSNLVQSSAKFWNVGALISGPILDFGRTKSNVKVAESRKRQAVINYVQTVKRAFSEVHEALLKLQSIKKEIDVQERLLENYHSILNTTLNRYENGLVDYLNVISAERNYERAQLNLVTLKKDYLKQEVLLYKALGGGWRKEDLFASKVRGRDK